MLLMGTKTGLPSAHGSPCLAQYSHFLDSTGSNLCAGYDQALDVVETGRTGQAIGRAEVVVAPMWTPPSDPYFDAISKA